MAVVVLDVGDQRLVQHEAVDEAVIEGLERNVTDPEMIQREPDAQFAQRLERLLFGGAFAHDVAVADFQLDTAGIEGRILERLGHGVDEPPVHELLRR